MGADNILQLLAGLTAQKAFFLFFFFLHHMDTGKI